MTPILKQRMSSRLSQYGNDEVGVTVRCTIDLPAPKQEMIQFRILTIPFRARAMTCSMAPRGQKMETVWLNETSITVEVVVLQG